MTQKKYDVVIVGGGIVGLSFALALSKNALNVAVLDKQFPSLNKTPHEISLQVSAITAESKKFLQSLDVWPLLDRKRLGSFHKIQIWDKTGEGFAEFDSHGSEEEIMGWIVENALLRQALYHCLQKTKVNCLNHHIENFHRTEKGLMIDLDNGEKIQTELLVGSDGGNSLVRKLAGIPIHERQYGHTAIVANVVCENPHRNTAKQFFYEEGILAYLPLYDSHACSIVWSVKPERAKILLEMEEEEFKKELSRVSFAIEKVGQRLSFPLKMRHAKNYIQERLVLIGDAAHTIHPLAGQGLNLGLRDARCLAEKILVAVRRKRFFYAEYTLRPYERERKSENTFMFLFEEGIKRLFESEAGVIKYLRQHGLNFTNSFPLLKNFFISFAGG